MSDRAIKHSRREDGTVVDDDGYSTFVKNPHIAGMEEDVLYHFALSTGTHDLRAMFGDVKFVCIGGSPRRMEKLAHFLVDELEYCLPAGQTLTDIAGATDRYAMYKVGPVLSVSHGMGIPSVSIMLHELIKLVYHAGCEDVTFFRIGTCGGLGLEPGTVVVSDSTCDGLFNPYLELHVLGKTLQRPGTLDKQIAEALLECSDPSDDFRTITGKTMCTLDFYEGQGRLDGAFCDYTDEDKMVFLRKAYNHGVRNIEMESLCFAAMTHHAGIKGAVVCVTLLDRLLGDQVSTPHHLLEQWQQRSQILVARYIRQLLFKEDNH
ncbi:uridine phosphorylase 1-like isoform X2 [Tubulanus polymorphus]|uniref:uridine phosphorylase 1-like isoform X2 n=1 Tax=Tubulanus polymorphus TaxID=672921 RepID=UPI003DA63E4F